MDAATGFGPRLREWRVARGLSQQKLAERAEVSTRHLSFLETGRSAPSREMVLVLANALDLPLRERNAFLGVAGFAAVYRESPLESPQMAQVQRALGFLLRQHEPYGAIVVDRSWNVLSLNQGAMRMMAFFIDADAPPVAQKNALHAVFHPAGLRRHMVDWETVAGEIADRLHREASAPGGEEVAELLRALLDYPDVPERFSHARTTAHPEPFLPVHLRKDGVDVRLFTLLATLGTPLDVTAQELRIESYFPADEATDRWIRSLSSSNA
jgi:transcriptional regulator with XRE-family HTH domain